MKTSARLLFACLALLLAPLTALAAGPGTPPTYTDEASFLSQIVAGTAVEEDFNDLTLGFTYTSPQTGRTVAPYSYDVSTSQGLFLAEGDPVPKDVWLTTTLPNTVITFASLSNNGDPVEAFGGQFFALDASGNFSSQQVTASINGGEYQLTKTPTSIADSFFGWIIGAGPGGTGGISSVSISIGTAPNSYVATNSVTFAVPEPSTYALLGFAVTTGGLCRIRRRLKVAA